MKTSIKIIAERFLLLFLIVIFSFALPIQVQNVYASGKIDVSSFAYSLIAPQSLESFDLYYSSQNFKVNEDAKWLKTFDSSFGPCDGSSAYMVFKAPEGKVFKKMIFETLCIGNRTADVYAYSDINDLSSECKLTSVNQTLTSYLGSWTRMKKLYTLFPDNTKYVKIEFSESQSAGDWGRHINDIGFDVVGENEALYGDMSIKEEFGTDLELYPGDGYIYEMVGMNKSPYFTSSGATGNIIARSNENVSGDAHLIFQAAPGYKMKNFSVKAIMINKCDYLSFYYSETADGEYKKLPMPEFTITSNSNWDTYVYTFDTLPKNTRYIKVCVPAVGKTYMYLIDNFSSDWAKISDEISEMDKRDYEYLSEKAPERPDSNVQEVTLNINAPSEFIYTNVLGQQVVMAPKGKKFASFTYSSTTNEPGTVYCSQNYTDGFVKAKSFEVDANSRSTCYYIDFLSVASGKASAVNESVVKSCAMPFNTHYLKITDTSVSNFSAVFADDDEIVKSEGTAENFSFNTKFEDDPYILDYGGLSNGYIRENYTIENENKLIYGALTVKEIGTPGYLVFGAPDNAYIKTYKLYVRNSGSNISPLFYAGNSDGSYVEITANKEQLATKLYSYTLSLPDGAEKVKLVLNGIDGDEKERFRVVGYSFDWNGNPENGNQAYKEYNINLNSNETFQTIKGWGVYPGSVYPVDTATDILCGTQRNEVKDALYKDLGVNTVRFELYSDYDREKKELIGNNMTKLINMIKGAQSYGLDYILTIWTAPSSMKTNSSTLGYNDDGTDAELMPECEGEFCEYIKLCLDTLVANGCKLPMSLSFTNEAEGNATWQACHYNTEQYVRVYKLLSQTLDNSGYANVKIHGSEAGSYAGMSTMFKSDFSAFDDTEFNDCFDILAYHAYSGINTDVYSTDSYLTAKEKIGNREIWQTEFTSTYNVKKAMQKICRDTRLIGTSRWFWWTGYIAANGGLIENGKDGGYVYTNIYKMLKAVYNGVPAGSKICSYTFDDNGLEDSAVDKDIVCNIATYKTPNGSAVILVNDSLCEKTYNISGLSGSEAKIQIYNPDSDEATEQCRTVENSKVKRINLKAGEIMVLSTEVPNLETDYSIDSSKNEVVADVTLRNQKGNSLMLCFAGYNGDSLVGTQCENIVVSSDNEKLAFALSAGNLDKVRMFVWKSQSLEPIADIAPYSITH